MQDDISRLQIEPRYYPCLINRARRNHHFRAQTKQESGWSEGRSGRSGRSLPHLQAVMSTSVMAYIPAQPARSPEIFNSWSP